MGKEMLSHFTFACRFVILTTFSWCLDNVERRVRESFNVRTVQTLYTYSETAEVLYNLPALLALMNSLHRCFMSCLFMQLDLLLSRSHVLISLHVSSIIPHCCFIFHLRFITLRSFDEFKSSISAVHCEQRRKGQESNKDLDPDSMSPHSTQH